MNLEELKQQREKLKICLTKAQRKGYDSLAEIYEEQIEKIEEFIEQEQGIMLKEKKILVFDLKKYNIFKLLYDKDKTEEFYNTLNVLKKAEKENKCVIAYVGDIQTEEEKSYLIKYKEGLI